jgi:hypothetical protein
MYLFLTQKEGFKSSVIIIEKQVVTEVVMLK